MIKRNAVDYQKYSKFIIRIWPFSENLQGEEKNFIGYFSIEVATDFNVTGDKQNKEKKHTLYYCFWPNYSASNGESNLQKAFRRRIDEEVDVNNFEDDKKQIGIEPKYTFTYTNVDTADMYLKLVNLMGKISDEWRIVPGTNSNYQQIKKQSKINARHIIERLLEEGSPRLYTIIDYIGPFGVINKEHSNLLSVLRNSQIRGVHKTSNYKDNLIYIYACKENIEEDNDRSFSLEDSFDIDTFIDKWLDDISRSPDFNLEILQAEHINRFKKMVNDKFNGLKDVNSYEDIQREFEIIVKKFMFGLSGNLKLRFLDWMRVKLSKFTNNPNNFLLRFINNKIDSTTSKMPSTILKVLSDVFTGKAPSIRESDFTQPIDTEESQDSESSQKQTTQKEQKQQPKSTMKDSSVGIESSEKSRRLAALKAMDRLRTKPKMQDDYSQAKELKDDLQKK